MNGPLGFYVDCDDAFCADCFDSEDIGSSWAGFEGWTEPLAIFEGDESDTPTHCHRCEALIEHALTSDGYAYVQDAFMDAALFGDGRRCIVRSWVECYLEDYLHGRALEVVQDWPQADAYSPVIVEASV